MVSGWGESSMEVGGGGRVWYGINGGKVIEWRFVISLDEGRDKPTTVFWRDNEVGWTRSDGG